MAIPRAQVVIPALEASKVSLLIVFPPCQSADSRLRNHQRVAIRGFPPHCRGGYSRPRSYQSVAMYRLPSLAQVMIPEIEVSKMSLVIVFRPRPRVGKH